ncbi:hypothetical protein SAMN04490220_0333 [Rhodococcus jostii]|uniref:Uncharacterized protein n=1 Tax=Rhodococcus jostii TaxID=132919 RepID=A0A1H4IP30_RHOJO|nr:hypothetical protein SAMN04490220_0333 [Rhodococcus jostii]
MSQARSPGPGAGGRARVSTRASATVAVRTAATTVTTHTNVAGTVEYPNSPAAPTPAAVAVGAPTGSYTASIGTVPARRSSPAAANTHHTPSSAHPYASTALPA